MGPSRSVVRRNRRERLFKTNMRHLLYNLALIYCLIAKQLDSIIDLALRSAEFNNPKTKGYIIIFKSRLVGSNSKER